MNKSNLFYIYKKDIIYKIFDNFNLKSLMQVPYIHKIVLNMGIGNAFYEKKKFSKYILDLSLISGQKPKITKSKRSISNFKIRKNYPIGCKVTLRNIKMWFFIEKLINLIIPRIKDFRGLSIKSFDNFGNYNIGIKELTIFPEIDYDNNINRGLDINICIKNTNIDKSLFLLKLLNFPFL